MLDKKNFVELVGFFLLFVSTVSDAIISNLRRKVKPWIPADKFSCEKRPKKRPLRSSAKTFFVPSLLKIFLTAPEIILL